MPYADYNNFDQRYFEGNSVDTPNPAGYSDYNRDLLPFGHYSSFLRQRFLDRGMDPTGAKVLIVGCAYGYTVEHFIDSWGIDCYGMDVSPYAVQQAQNEIAYGDRIYQGNVLSSQNLRSVRQSTQGGRFQAIVTECVLECLTDSEAQTAAANVRSEAQRGVYHRVWSSDGSDVNPEWYNSKTLAGWKSLCDPSGTDVWHHEREYQPEVPT